MKDENIEFGIKEKMRFGAVEAVVWQETHDPENTWVTLQRVYRDREGEWRKTGCFRPRDISNIREALNMAAERVVA